MVVKRLLKGSSIETACDALLAQFLLLFFNYCILQCIGRVLFLSNCD